MSLDLDFYKKDYVEIEDDRGNGTIKNKEVFKKILFILDLENKDDVNGQFVEIPLDKKDEVLKVLGEYNKYGFYDKVIGEIVTLYSRGEKVYFNANW